MSIALNVNGQDCTEVVREYAILKQSLADGEVVEMDCPSLRIVGLEVQDMIVHDTSLLCVTGVQEGVQTKVFLHVSQIACVLQIAKKRTAPAF